jgi:hypothetical protein
MRRIVTRILNLFSHDACQAGFNVIMGGFGALDPDSIDSQLAAAEELGIGAVVRVGPNRETIMSSIDIQGNFARQQ